MKYDPKIHHRRSIRLKEYDYSQYGYYFITICVQNKTCLFGNIINNEMKLNAAGKMVATKWQETTTKFKHVEMDDYVVMPNHFHAIIRTRAPGIKAHLGYIIGAFKSITTHEYINGVKNYNWRPFDKRLWQRNYYEYIIRHDLSLEDTRKYIIENPANWRKDKMFFEVN